MSAQKPPKMNLRPVPTTVSQILCLRCGHRWLPRVRDVRRCPSCQSPYYNRPREKEVVRRGAQG